jgi:guanylate kinase
MSKVFLIIGKSYSGKDTLLNQILDDKEFCEKINLERLVLYTTRKPRPNEVDGETYHFINDETCFENDYIDTRFTKSYSVSSTRIKNKAVTVSYNQCEFGRLFYVTDFSKLEPGKNYILTAAPEMIKPYKEILGDNLCVIYLCPPNWVLFERFTARNDNTEYSNMKYKEICRRFLDDVIKFSKTNEFIANTTCIINLGRDVFINAMKDKMEAFLKDVKTCSILNRNGNHTFSNKYEPSGIYYLYTYNQIVDGNIELCNGDIVLNTEEEQYEVRGKSNL